MEHAGMKKYTERAEKVALALQAMWVELDMADMEARELVLQLAK